MKEKDKTPSKRVKNIEDKNKQQFKAIKSKNENVKKITDFSQKIALSLEAKALIVEIKIIQRVVDYRKLKITGGNSVLYSFSDYKNI